MKAIKNGILIFLALGLFVSCAGIHSDRFNTQRGAAIGAGFGALAGQLIGRNTHSTLLGAGVGTLVGAIVGNAVDQESQIAREAAATNRRIVYYDEQQDHAIEVEDGIGQQGFAAEIAEGFDGRLVVGLRSLLQFLQPGEEFGRFRVALAVSLAQIGDRKAEGLEFLRSNRR